MADTKTNSFFIPKKISVILDGGAGSSGKGKIGAYMVKNSHKVNFVCNTFMPQASHTVIEKDEHGKEIEYVYKQLNSCAHLHDKFDKMYIGQGSVIDVNALMKEIKMTGIPTHKLGISPVATILQDIDTQFEEGKADLEGNPLDHDGTIKFGSTCSGVGAARARRVLRKPNIKLARDVEELKPYLCDVSSEIMDRLDAGHSGLLEVAQGFQLSYGLAQFYPYTTSRNCSVSAGFDDMMLPASYLGNVCINFRTYPIRIHSKKYLTVPTEEQQKMMDDVKVEIPAGDPNRPEVAEKVEEAKEKLSNPKGYIAEHMEGGRPKTKVIPAELEDSFLDYKGGLAAGNDFVMERDQFFEWYNRPNVQRIVNEHILSIQNSSNPVSQDKDAEINEFTPRHLTWDEVQGGEIPYKEIDSYSGDFYADQTEITWEELTRLSGAPKLIMECTTLTKLPRRVATFSQTNLLESIRYNQTNHQIWISVNFLNYVSWGMGGETNIVDQKSRNWLNTIVNPVLRGFDNVYLKLLGTGAGTDETIMIE